MSRPNIATVLVELKHIDVSAPVKAHSVLMKTHPMAIQTMIHLTATQNDIGRSMNDIEKTRLSTASICVLKSSWHVKSHAEKLRSSRGKDILIEHWIPLMKT